VFDCGGGPLSSLFLYMSSVVSSLSTDANVVPTCVKSDRSFDELVNELSCIGSTLSGLLIVMTADVLIIDSHVGGVAGTHLCCQSADKLLT